MEISKTDLDALNAYMGASDLYQIFIDGSVDEVPNGNGDDTVALLLNGEVVDRYGDIGVDGDDGWSDANIYDDTWGYRNALSVWYWAPTNSSDGTETTCDSEFPYPFAVCDTSSEVVDFLVNAGNWRVQAEAEGHMGVGPNEAANSDWWTADPFTKASSGLYDDRYTFHADGTFTFSAGADSELFGKVIPLERDLITCFTKIKL